MPWGLFLQALQVTSLSGRVSLPFLATRSKTKFSIVSPGPSGAAVTSVTLSALSWAESRWRGRVVCVTVPGRRLKQRWLHGRLVEHRLCGL